MLKLLSSFAEAISTQFWHSGRSCHRDVERVCREGTDVLVVAFRRGNTRIPGAGGAAAVGAADVGEETRVGCSRDRTK